MLSFELWRWRSEGLTIRSVVSQFGTMFGAIDLHTSVGRIWAWLQIQRLSLYFCIVAVRATSGPRIN